MFESGMLVLWLKTWFVSVHALSIILSIILVLVAVAYYIVTERKGLGMLQLRIGPNKVGVKGLVQPVRDGVKLFRKEVIRPHDVISKPAFIMGPSICFLCAYVLWAVMPHSAHINVYEAGVLFFVTVSSFRVFGVFIVGWVCDSVYGFLGAIRAVAQAISYEVFMSLVLISPLLMFGRVNLHTLRDSLIINGILMLDVSILWFISCLAETNRTPFDFVEGESELVAGFIVEFGGSSFALLALAEYSNILFISLLSCTLFLRLFVSSYWLRTLALALITTFLGYLFVWIRGTLPRYRYDLLIKLCWEILLPCSLLFLSFTAVILF
jgi:NADH:ubiquinone oxidoreductase subunit H